MSSSLSRIDSNEIQARNYQRVMMKRANQVYVPPSMIAGELIVHKGYFWRVQAFSPNGGDVTLTDENGTHNAIAQSACVVLELYKKTTGTEKKERRAGKHAAKSVAKGFRTKTLGIKDYSPVVIPQGSTIISPTEEDIRRVS
jgi:hypothetical protein